MKRFRKSAGVWAVALCAFLLLLHRAQAAPPAVGQGSEPSGEEAQSECKCNCEDCAKMGGSGHMHGGHGAHPMMEGMKKHMEEVRKSVAALREHEKKLEGIADPAEFRKAAIEHFRMLDDLQESHVKHMDSMMGDAHERMRQGHERPHQ